MAKKEKKGIDLASLDLVAFSNEGHEVELVHPVSRETLGITITVTGRDGDVFMDLMTQQNRDRMKRAAKAKKLEIDTDQIKSDAIDLLTACTIGWKGMILDGKELEFNEKNVKAVYKRFLWIREQIDDAIGNRANFMKG